MTTRVRSSIYIIKTFCCSCLLTYIYAFVGRPFPTVSILLKSILDHYRLDRTPVGPITGRHRFKWNVNWDFNAKAIFLMFVLTLPGTRGTCRQRRMCYLHVKPCFHGSPMHTVLVPLSLPIHFLFTQGTSSIS